LYNGTSKSTVWSTAGLFNFGKSAISEQIALTSPFEHPTSLAISSCVQQASHPRNSAAYVQRRDTNAMLRVC